MDKAKLIALALLLCGLSGISASAQEYSWSRYTMDGSRTDGVAKLKGTAAKEAKLIERYSPQMAYLQEPLGYCPEAMTKFRPESPLSNWLADLMLEESERVCGEKCDVSLTNFGGIRTDMSQGEVVVDDIRSMLPFKNYVVFLKMSGDSLWTLLNNMTLKNRFEVLGGVKVRVREDTLYSVEIGGSPLIRGREYKMISNSFLLDGGDGIFLRRASNECRVLDTDFYEMTVEHLRRCRAEGREITGRRDARILKEIKYVSSSKSSSSSKGKVDTSKPVPFKYEKDGEHSLTILHTNDVHSHIQKIRGGKNDGLGGIVERAAFIDSVRRADGRRNVLLLDAGDWDQGTSWFSVLRGKAEIEAMNIMRYDAATIGNHEWDNGIEELAGRIGKAHFKTLLCNYNINDKKLNRCLKPYTIVRRGGKKIGIIGVLVNVSTSVTHEVASQLEYIRPDGPVNKWAKFLKEEKHCDLVIVLSHLGMTAYNTDLGDVEMTPYLRNVDIIVGGHSHTDQREPKYVNDADGKPVLIVQDYCWGVYVGEIKL